MAPARARSLIACALCWPVLLGAGDVDRVRVNIENGRLRFAPADLRLKVFVEPDQANRLLIVEAEGGTFYRRSDEDLSGDSPRTRWIERWRGVPAGVYVIRATVRTASGAEYYATDELEVRGLDASP